MSFSKLVLIFHSNGINFIYMLVLFFYYRIYDIFHRSMFDQDVVFLHFLFEKN